MDRAFVRDKISIRGTFALRSAGASSPRTIFFDSSQDIESSVFMIGRKIEKSVVSEFAGRNPEVRDLNLAWIEKEVAAEETSEDA